MADVIAHMSADCGGYAAYRGTSISTGVQASKPTPPAPKPTRVVAVNPQALRMFRAHNITPPEGEGEKFKLADLDRKLSGLDVSTCLAIKLHLRDAGLL